jgi:hypothetical protein
VLKNFVDLNLERDYANNEVKFVNLGNEPVGEYIKKGLILAKGEIVSFLDDDDIFYPNKLDTVYKIFQQNEKLIYLHNNFSYEENKRKTKFQPKKRFINDIVIRNNGGLERINSHKLNIIWKNSLAINLSSVSIKKNSILENVLLFKNITGMTDYFILMCCLLKNDVELLFSTKILNMYKISEGETHSTDLFEIVKEKLIKLSKAQIQSAYPFVSLMAWTPYQKLPLFILSQWRLIYWIGNVNERTTKLFLKDLYFYLKYNLFRKPIFAIPLLIISCLSIVFPMFSLKIFLILKKNMLY